MKIQLPIAAIAAAVLLTAAPASATTYDLTAGGQYTINGALFITSDYAATGTGLIDSFVRMTTNDGTEEGYNATARPVMDDVNTSPTFTHDLLLSAVGEATFNGVTYYEFLLDDNQTNNNPLLSLDQLQIYTRATAITDANDLLSLSSSSNLIYNMDAGTNNEVLLNYSLNNGSGSGDLFVYVLKSLFGAETQYVYLYSQFGAKGGAYAANDGFEEWAVRNTQITQVPDGGSTVALLGSALLGISMLRRRFAR